MQILLKIFLKGLKSAMIHAMNWPRIGHYLDQWWSSLQVSIGSGNNWFRTSNKWLSGPMMTQFTDAYTGQQSSLS